MREPPVAVPQNYPETYYDKEHLTSIIKEGSELIILTEEISKFLLESNSISEGDGHFFDGKSRVEWIHWYQYGLQHMIERFCNPKQEEQEQEEQEQE